ncbi:hypothetical protein HPB50_029455 [Hyalomma asiaticum]|nr:hypothetical protein HPB50_029455 [Hyalomma asiaticum]
MDPQIDAISRRPRVREAKAKLSFGSTSADNSSSPCRLRADSTRLIAPPETPLKGEGDEHRADLTINVTEKTGPITAIKAGENYEGESVQSIKPLATNCDVATSTLVHHPSSIEGDHRIITVENEAQSLTETDVSNIVRHMRQLLQNKARRRAELLEAVLQDKGPSQEQELVEAVTSLHADLVLNIHGMMTAFLNQRQGFVVVKKDRYSSVHYEYLDGEVQDNSTSRMKHEEITGSASAASNDDQDESVSDGETYHECVAITSSRPYIQFTIGENTRKEKSIH